MFLDIGVVDYFVVDARELKQFGYFDCVIWSHAAQVLRVFVDFRLGERDKFE